MNFLSDFSNFSTINESPSAVACQMFFSTMVGFGAVGIEFDGVDVEHADEVVLGSCGTEVGEAGIVDDLMSVFMVVSRKFKEFNTIEQTYYGM